MKKFSLLFLLFLVLLGHVPLVYGLTPLVGGKGTASTDASGNSLVTSAFDISPANKSVIVCSIHTGSTGAAVSSITDSVGSNTYTKLAGDFTDRNTTHEIWFAKNITGGSNFTVTINFAINGQFRRAICAELRNVDPTPVISNDWDYQLAAAFSTSTDGVTFSCCPIFSIAGAIVVATVHRESGSVATISPGTGYTLLSAINGTDTLMEYKISSADGNDQPTWTWSSNANAGGTFVSFLQAGDFGVGPREEILATGTKPDGWPDGTMSVEKSGSLYTFYGANGNGHTSPDGLPRITSGTLLNPIGISNNSVTISGLSTACTHYAGGGPTYRIDANTILMFVHCEHWPGGVGSRFWASIGMAKSTDNGATWAYLGDIIQHQSPYNEANTCNAEIGMGAYLTISGYFYVYTANRLGTVCDFNDVSLSVARALVTDVVTAAGSNTVTTFSKYCNGTVQIGTFGPTACASSGAPWGEAGLGGLSSPLWVANSQSLYPTLSYNTALSKYVLIANAGNDFAWPATDLIYMDSSDGITWGNWRTVVAGGNTVNFYPTIVGTGTDLSTTGRDFWVYYVFNSSTAGSPLAAGPLSRRLVMISACPRTLLGVGC